MTMFDELNRSGHTHRVITHEASVASRAKRAIRIQDGLIVSDQQNGKVRA